LFNTAFCWGLTNLVEGGNGHRGEQTDDNHHDHDFDEGEALLAIHYDILRFI
jgi:hypothetical protein